MYHWTYLLFVIVKCCYLSTLFEIFILCPKIQRWFAEKIVEWKTRENVVVFDFLAVDNFDFTRKIVKKIWWKNSWKCWDFVKIEFLDKKLTFRIVCNHFFSTQMRLWAIFRAVLNYRMRIIIVIMLISFDISRIVVTKQNI